ncbi:PAC2 family protein [Planctomonas psychrotolerans]|uniref:PAC2 family protein n=1 Tax=Planctomonas psychrotolerans TaxID=2528712 RepID=UPI001239354A|nr:PAC2 family protein [Planctomonas psychrotolerans]
MVVAFEGWNDAGEAASGAVRALKDLLDLIPLAQVDPQEYFDFQFTRPQVVQDDDGRRLIEWPGATIYGPREPKAPGLPLAADADLAVSGDNGGNIYLLLGTEPSRRWKNFTAEVLDTARTAGVQAIVLLGALLADVPHTRPISVFATSENATVRTELGIERSTYEGPVGILSVIAEAAEAIGIPTVSVWASVPHYVHNAPSPKATLALIDRLEEMVDVVIPRAAMVEEAAAWETGIDALAGEDEEMAAYIEQLEQARDTVDSPEASGEAIAQEFEKYLRRDDGRDGRGDRGDRPDEPRRPRE